MFLCASCDGNIRRVLWTDLINSTHSLPWMVVGDFNVVHVRLTNLGEMPLILMMSQNLIQ